MAPRADWMVAPDFVITIHDRHNAQVFFTRKWRSCISVSRYYLQSSLQLLYKTNIILSYNDSNSKRLTSTIWWLKCLWVFINHVQILKIFKCVDLQNSWIKGNIHQWYLSLPWPKLHLLQSNWPVVNPGGGGGSFTKIVRGCACRTSKIWLSLYQFFAKFPTHQYTIFERKTPNFDQIGCFLQ